MALNFLLYKLQSLATKSNLFVIKEMEFVECYSKHEDIDFFPYIGITEIELSVIRCFDKKIQKIKTLF